MFCVLTDISSKIYFIGRHLTYWVSSKLCINSYTLAKFVIFGDHIKIRIVLLWVNTVFAIQQLIYIHTSIPILLHQSSPNKLD